MATAYRFFAQRGSELVSRIGNLTWPKPNNGEPGKWVEHAGPCVLCQSGLHASLSVRDALREAQGWVLGMVEAEGIEARDDSKFSARRMRVVRVYERQHVTGLAALAAIMAHRHFDSKHPKDRRPRNAIEAAIAWIENPYAAAAESYAARVAAYSAAAAAAAESYAAGAARVAAYSAESAARAADESAYSVESARAAESYAESAAYSAAESAAAAARTQFNADFNELAVAILALPADRIAPVLRNMLDG